MHIKQMDVSIPKQTSICDMWIIANLFLPLQQDAFAFLGVDPFQNFLIDCRKLSWYPLLEVECNNQFQ
jgi:hypothetical protein